MSPGFVGRLASEMGEAASDDRILPFPRTIVLFMVIHRVGGRERMRAGCEMLLVCGGCNEESAGLRNAVNGYGFGLEVPRYCCVSIQYMAYFVSNNKRR